jgi:hypothetical protein
MAMRAVDRPFHTVEGARFDASVGGDGEAENRRRVKANARVNERMMMMFFHVTIHLSRKDGNEMYAVTI